MAETRIAPGGRRPTALARAVLSLAALAAATAFSLPAAAATPDGGFLKQPWGPAELVQRTRAKIHDHTVAGDGAGGALAVWEEDVDPARDSLWASGRGASGGWSVPERIGSGFGNADLPRLAFAPGTGALVLWQQQEGRWRNIWGNRLDGAGWRIVERLEIVQGRSGPPHLAARPDGGALAVWAKATEGPAAIVAAVYESGAGWRQAVPISSGAGEAETPRVAADGRGNAVAVWAQAERGGRRRIHAARLAAGKGWGAPAALQQPGEDGYAPRLAGNGAGAAMAVWEQEGSGGESVWAARFDPAGGWGRAVRVEQPGAEGYAPDVAMDAAGNAIAVWAREQDGVGVIWAARFSAGKGWAPPHRIQTGDADYAYAPRVAMDQEGNAVAVWYQTDVIRNNVWGNRFAPGAGWGRAELLERRTGAAYGPAVTVDAGGRFHAIWKMVDGYDPDDAWHTLWVRALPARPQG